MRNWEKTVFLAHASEDKDFVRKLYKALDENGLDPWLDEEDLMPGVLWDKTILEAIKKSRFFIACISGNSITKDGYVQKELRYALSILEQKSPDSIYFIPALIENVQIPNITVNTINLSDYQAARIYDQSGLEKLIKTLQKQVDIIVQIKSTEKPIFDSIRREIADGRIESALRQLLATSKRSDEDYYNSVLMLTSKYNTLHKENVLGLISSEYYSMENNKIVYSILEILKILEKLDK